MLTRCCICGVALEVEWPYDDNAFCADCLRANFAGQKNHDVDASAPRITVVGLPARQRTQEAADAR